MSGDLPEVKLKALVNFPADVIGGVAIDIDKAAGRYTVSTDYSEVQEVSNVQAGDVSSSRLLVWNKHDDSYSAVPYALSATAGVASLGGAIGAIDLGFGLGLTGTTLKNTAIPSAGGALGTVLRATGAGQFPSYRKSGFVSTEEFDCAGDGVTVDDEGWEDLEQFLYDNGGGNVYLHGPLLLSHEFTMRTGNVTFFADGNFKGGFLVKSGTVLGNGLLQFSNLSNVAFEKVFFNGTGNMLEPNAGGAGFIGYFNDINSATDTLNLSIKRCIFTNSRASNYIFLAQSANAGNTNKMRGVTISDCYFNADAAYAPTVGGNTFIGIRGNTLTGSSSDNGSISNALFSNNRATGIGCSGFVNGLYNCHDITCVGNNTQFMGNNTVAEDRAYTYSFYRSDATARSPRNITIVGNVGHGNHANAAYLAGAEDVTVVGNVFTDTRTSSIYPSLPHGFAIAFNGCKNITCNSNVLLDNAGGIYYGQDKDKQSTDVISNNVIRCSSIAGLNATGILISPDASASASDNKTTFIVANNNIAVTGASALGIAFNPTFQLGRGRILNNAIKSEVQGIGVNTDAIGNPGVVLATELTFSGDSINGALSNYAAVISCGSSPLYIRNETIDFSEVTAGSSGGYNLDGNTKLMIDGLTLANKTNTGASFSGIGTQANFMDRVTFPGTTSTPVLATSIGLARPNWPGYVGGYIQNLATTRKVGTTPTAYTLKGYDWDSSSTWTDFRTGLY